MLSAPFLYRCQGYQSQILGSGLLHHIWFSQQYGRQMTFLSAVKQPTELNLRVEGHRNIHLSTNIIFRNKLEEAASMAGHRKQELGGLNCPVKATKGLEFFQITTQYSNNTEHKLLSAHCSASYSQVVCLTLHILLVLGHLALLGISVKKKEHDIVFPINRQSTISICTKILATSLGTVWAYLLSGLH
jgi:hypothetical protein